MLILQTWTSRSSIRLTAASCRHHRSPTSAIRPAGRDLGARWAPGITDSTAPIAAECQSFLDNVVAEFSTIRSWNNHSLVSRRDEGQPKPYQRSNPTPPAINANIIGEFLYLFM